VLIILINQAVLVQIQLVIFLHVAYFRAKILWPKGGFTSNSSSKGKKVNRQKSRSLNKLPREIDSIVNVLLANPQSLALLCLERSDYGKAQQVVQVKACEFYILFCLTYFVFQTFQLLNTEIGNEASFLELFHSLSVEVSNTSGFCISNNMYRDYATQMSPTSTKMLVSCSLEVFLLRLGIIKLQ
jgi:hypothetical protein